MVGGSVKWDRCCGKTIAIPFSVSTEKRWKRVHEKPKWVFTTALFITAKMQKQPQCPSPDLKMWYIHSMVCYSERNEVQIHAVTQKSLKSVVLSAGSHSQKATCCLIPLMGNVQNRHVHRDRKWMNGGQGLGGKRTAVMGAQLCELHTQVGEYYGMGIISIKMCTESFPHGGLLGCLEHSTVDPRNKTSKGIWIKYHFKLGRRQQVQIRGRDWVKRGQKELHARVCMYCLRKGHVLHRRGEGAGEGCKNFTSNEQSLLKQEPINPLLHRCTLVCLPHHHMCYEVFLYS